MAPLKNIYILIRLAAKNKLFNYVANSKKAFLLLS